MESEIMTEEIFGPLCPIIPIKSMKEAISIINGKDKPLAVYYFGDESGQNCQTV
jgi:acyl-CoA reductase-like NAD-dependent aldehyde dehydrogenase